MENKWYKNRIFIVGIAAVLIIVGALVMGDKDDQGDEDENQVTEAELTPQGNEIVVEGKISCLPLKSGAKTSEEDCVKGIESSDDKVYALNTISLGVVEAEMKLGKKVTAVGEVEPANTSSQESSVFVYDAVLVVRAIK